jgi:hypothetical protein
MAMNNSKLLSGRVPVTPYSNLTNDRYQFLGLDQAEPSLGSGANNSVLTISTSNSRVWSNALNLSSLTVNGESNLGNIGNIHITGGSNGQVVTTDGFGNLTFTTVSSGSSNLAAPMPYFIPTGEAYTVSNNFQGLFNIPITIDGELEVDGVLIEVEGSGGGGTATGLNATIENVSISGGTSGYYLQTDGAGVLSWASGGGGGSGSPGGVNTQIQFNDAGLFGGNTGFTFNKTTGVFSAPNIIVTGNITPSANVTYSLGNNTNRFSDLYLAGNTINLGAAIISANATAIVFTNPQGGTFAVTGNSTSSDSNLGNVATANYFVGNGNGLSNIQGANISGAVLYATTANAVAVANVSGIGNISTINLDGNAGNILYGNGVFASTSAISNAANANFANFAGTALDAGNSNLANTANSVAVANVSGIGNIATVNLDGNSSNVLFGNGVFSPIPVVNNVANANYANFAGTAFNVSGSNVSGEVANAAYANITGVANSVAGANVSGEVSFAATANSVAGANVSGTVANATFALNAGNSNLANTANSVAVANVSGIGNIATINLDGNAGNILYGNGVFATAGAGGGTPGGTNTQVQFNDAGLFGGNTGFTFNKTTGVFSAPNIVATGNTNADNLNVNRVIATGNVSGTQLISNIATGTAPLVVTSTTEVANLRAATAGTVTTNAQPNITSVGTLSGLTVTNTITGNITGSAGSAGLATTAATVTTNAQPNITSVGTLSSLTITGNISAGNVIGTLNGSGSNITAINASNISSGTLVQARLANSAVTLGSTALTLGDTVTTVAGLSSVTSTSFVGALTGAASTAGTVTTNAQPNITSVGTLSSLAVTGNANVGNLNASGISNLGPVSNVIITGGTANFVLQTDGVGNLSWVEQTSPISNIPPNDQTSAYILVSSDVGKYINITTGGVTVPASVFSSGDTLSIYNNSASVQTITQAAGVTMYLVGTATTGNRTLAQRGLATLLCVGANTFVITGGGLT